VVDDRGKPADIDARVVLVCNYCIDSLDDAEFVALAIHVEFASEIRAAEAIARAEGRRQGLEEAAKEADAQRDAAFEKFGGNDLAIVNDELRVMAKHFRALAKETP